MRVRASENDRSRRGVHLVESAIVYPIVLLLLIGVLVVGLGVFRYQQMASLARDGARWASVRGGRYQTDLNPEGASTLPKAATPADVRDYIESRAVLLDLNPEALDVQVSWDQTNRQTHVLEYSYGYPQVDASGLKSSRSRTRSR